jgi:hypothetical protein
VVLGREFSVHHPLDRRPEGCARERPTGSPRPGKVEVKGRLPHQRDLDPGVAGDGLDLRERQGAPSAGPALALEPGRPPENEAHILLGVGGRPELGDGVGT